MMAPAPLQRFVSASRRRRAGSCCERCPASLSERHRHAVDLATHRLLCVCEGCTRELAALDFGSCRVVPESVRRGPSFAESPLETLGVPVRMAFLVRLSQQKRWAALLPSPAGATEIEISEQAWSELMREGGSWELIAPDVEGLILRGTRAGAVESFIAPIDVCYELVGLVRQNWRGLDGGQPAREEIDAFFERLRQRAGDVGWAPLAGAEP